MLFEMFLFGTCFVKERRTMVPFNLEVFLVTFMVPISIMEEKHMSNCDIPGICDNAWIFCPLPVCTIFQEIKPAGPCHCCLGCFNKT